MHRESITDTEDVTTDGLQVFTCRVYHAPSPDDILWNCFMGLLTTALGNKIYSRKTCHTVVLSNIPVVADYLILLDV